MFPTLHGPARRAREPGEHGRLLGERVDAMVGVIVGVEPASAQQATHAGMDRPQDTRDLLVGRAASGRKRSAGSAAVSAKKTSSRTGGWNIHGRGFWLFRHRPHPTDPEKMLFDFQDYLRWPESLGPRERPPHRRDVQGGTSLGIVLDQDLYNLPRVQAGMRSRAFAGLLLNRQERRIRHFHRTLEGYVGA